MLNKFIKLFKKNPSIKVQNNSDVNIDIGASSVKYFVNGATNSFISSVRVVENDCEIVDQKNVIKVNGVWYAVGESKTPVSSEIRKAFKEHLEVMFVYCLVKENLSSGSYNINTLLPYNQLKDRTQLLKRVNATYKVESSQGQKFTYDINVSTIKCEGQMSYYYLKNTKDISTVIVNVGFSTTDISVFKGEEQEEPITLQTGTNIILSQYKNKLDAPNVSVLSYRLLCGDTFTKEEEIENLRSANVCISGLVNDIRNVLRFVPTRSRVIICGGGSILYGGLIKDKLKGNFKNVDVLTEDITMYTDVLGLSIFCAKHSTQLNFKPLETAEPVDITPNINVKDITQENVTTHNSTQDPLYSNVLKRLREIERNSIISAKILGMSDYSWRKVKLKLIEDGLAYVNGTNTHKKP